MKQQAEIKNQMDDKMIDIKNMLMAIEAKMSEKASNPTWGTVGDAGHIASELAAMCDFLGIEKVEKIAK